VQKLEPKKDWTLTPEAFEGLLVWLDEGTSSGGETYLEMRRRLVVYFDRKNCALPDDLADETLNRVARRLKEEGTIVTDAPAHYCYIVARYVLLEFLRKEQPHESLNERLLFQQHTTVAPPLELSYEGAEKERRWDCLEGCVGKIDSESRELIVGYYHGEQRVKIENRRAMAERLGITMNALSIRACRIRGKLEECIQKCMKAPT
jgi:DNA-directed RNA polymerase specialized sigma24 family protein